MGLLDPDPGGPSQTAALRGIAEKANLDHRSLGNQNQPVPLAVIPASIPLTRLDIDPPRQGSGPHLLTGVGGDYATSLWLDLNQAGPGFAIGGPPRSGKTNTLIVMAKVLLKQKISLVLIAGRSSTLLDLADSEGVKGTFDSRALDPARFSKCLSEVGTRTALLVDDAESIADATVIDALAAFTRSARDYGHVVIVAGTTSEMISGFRGFIPEVRKSKTGLLLTPESPGDGDLLGLRLPRTALFQGPPGRAVHIAQGDMKVVQVPHDMPQTSIPF